MSSDSEQLKRDAYINIAFFLSNSILNFVISFMPSILRRDSLSSCSTKKKPEKRFHSALTMTDSIDRPQPIEP